MRFIEIPNVCNNPKDKILIPPQLIEEIYISKTSATITTSKKMYTSKFDENIDVIDFFLILEDYGLDCLVVLNNEEEDDEDTTPDTIGS